MKIVLQGQKCCKASFAVYGLMFFGFWWLGRLSSK